VIEELEERTGVGGEKRERGEAGGDLGQEGHRSIEREGKSLEYQAKGISEEGVGSNRFLKEKDSPISLRTRWKISGNLG
jgi:hypothetical protein